MGRGGGLVMAAFLSEADADGFKHLHHPYRLRISVAQPRMGALYVLAVIICSLQSEATAEKVFAVVNDHVQKRLMPDIMGDAESSLVLGLWSQYVCRPWI